MANSSTPNPTGSEKIDVFQRNHTAAVRMNLQHWTWHRELGYNIHPSIPIPPHDAHIADIATGTALWLLEVAEQYPNAQCDGFDIKLGQGPANDWLPANVKLHHWDMMDPSGVPGGLKGHYDFVHVRNVILAVESDVDQLIRNLLDFLKPGGWLQWDEINFDRPVHAHALNADRQIGEYMADISRRMTERSRQDWCRRMPEVLESYGFERAERFETQPDKKMLKLETDLMLMIWDEILAIMPEPRKEMFTKLVDGMRNDAARGSGIAYAKTVTVARKPS